MHDPARTRLALRSDATARWRRAARRTVVAAVGVSVTTGTAISTGAAPVSALPETYLVTTVSDDPADGLTLREAVGLANANVGSDTIEFAPSALGTHVLDGGAAIAITDHLTIDGPGSDLVTIDAVDASRVFDLSTGGIDVELNGLHLTRGASAAPGGAIRAIALDDFTMNDVVISNSHTDSNGGAVELTALTGGVTFVGSRFEDNTALLGGGAVWITDGSPTGVEIRDSEFVGNTATAGPGGGLAIEALDRRIAVTGTDFEGNEVLDGDVGAVRLAGRSVSLDDVEMVGNVASHDVGALDVETATEAATITDSRAAGNVATTGSGGAGRVDSGGGITVTGSDIVHNRAFDGGGLALSSPGEPISVSSSVFDDNDSERAGANLRVSSASSFSLSASTVSNGDAKQQAGVQIGSVVSSTIDRSTISSNTATAPSGGGGGVSVINFSPATLTVSHSTISGNAVADDGGGIRAMNTAVTVAHSTIVDNSAAGDGGGIALAGTSWASLTHSILSNSSPGDPDLSGASSSRWSIMASTPTLFAVGDGNQFGVDPLLGPLADNGGPTLTHLPGPNSPAIESGDPSIVWAATDTDQRGSSRVVGVLDIGSVERSADGAGGGGGGGGGGGEATTDLWVPVAPARFVDTRLDGVTIDASDQAGGRRGAGSETRIRIAGRGEVPSDALGVLANFTAVRPDGVGYFTVHPCVEPKPLAASLNYTADVNLGTEIIVGLDDGDVCVFTSEDTHLTVDVVGYVPSDSPYEPRQPARLLDTRVGGSTFDGLAQGDGRPGPGTTVEVPIGQRAGVPSGSAVVVYVAAVRPIADGYVTVWDCDGEPPLVAAVNHVAGVNRGNEVISALSDDGTLCLFTERGSDLTVDLVGVVPDGAGSTLLDPPGRILDTRPDAETIDGTFVGAGSLAPGETLVLDVAGRGGIPVGADTVSLNLTSVQPQDVGYITAFPCADDVPLAASLNYTAGVNGGNEIIASLDHDGRLCLFSSERTHLTVDVTGSTTKGAS